MGMISSIQRQSRRSYIVSQTALAAAVLSAGGAAALSASDRLTIGAMLFCAGAVALSMFVLHQARSGLYHRLGRVRDLETERQRLLERDAGTDALTRRFFLDRLENSLKRRSKEARTTLGVIDIDHFKQLNDSLGHPAGDAALAHLVRCVAEAMPLAEIGRLGGDEFAFFVEDDETAHVPERLSRLFEVVREPFLFNGQMIAVSLSAGIAHAPDDGDDVTTLIQNADIALYASKVSGRGRATHFHSEMLTDLRHVRYIERELRAGIFLNHLELHYQPIVDAAGRPHGYEALARWRHSARGLIPPGDFIEIAERSTLIDTLGEWVLRQACLDLPKFDGCRLSINVSGEQLKRDTIVSMARRILAQTGCDASRFVLEITETVATDATPDVLARLEALRAMGFRIALDDFGTGHCGFNSLKMLPVDCIKIDRMFVQNLRHDRVAQILVSALAQIGQLEDILIVAEGIETEDDMAMARAAGCNRFQGFHIGRPKALATPTSRRVVGAPEERRLSA